MTPRRKALEEWLSKKLANYDQSLRDGTSFSGSINLAVEMDVAADDAAKRFEVAKECLDLLHQFLRQDSPPDDVSAAAEGDRVAGDGDDRFLPLRVNDQFGRFKVRAKLGAGGYAAVYLAEDTASGESKALKVPLSGNLREADRAARFLAEARATQRLDHPHITRLLEAGEVEGTPYLVYAFCPGPTLEEMLADRSHHPAPSRSAAELVLPLAQAVQHAHEQGVVHRDIKPSNVLLWPVPSGDGEIAGVTMHPELTDFGLARVADVSLSLTATGTAVGTPQYMAPETVRGGAADHPAVDVYGLGLLLYELLTGQTPLQGENLIHTMWRVIHEFPTPPKQLIDVDAEINAICLKCLAKDPSHRYTRAADLVDDLRRYLAGQPTAALAERRVQMGRRLVRSMAVVMLLLLAAVFSVRLAGWLRKDAAKPNAIVSVDEPQPETTAPLPERRPESRDLAPPIRVTIDSNSFPFTFPHRVPASHQWSRLVPVAVHHGGIDPALQSWEDGIFPDGIVGPSPDQQSWLVNDHGDDAAMAYRRFLPIRQQMQARSNGWVLRARIHVLESIGRSVSAAVSDGQRMFGFSLERTKNRQGVRVHLHGGETIDLGRLADSFHQYDLVYDPDQGSVELFVDGLRKSSRLCPGEDIPTDALVVFGSLDKPNRGAAYYGPITLLVNVPVQIVPPLFLTAGGDDPLIHRQHQWQLADPDAVRGLACDDGLAWRVEDLTTASPNPGYARLLSVDEQAAAVQLGWCLASRMRNVTGVHYASTCTFFDGERAFGFSVRAAGPDHLLIVMRNGESIRLSNVGNDFHDYELIFDPIDQSADLYFDGVRCNRNDYAGQDVVTPSRVFFGSADSWGVGGAEYALVAFGIGTTERMTNDE